MWLLEMGMGPTRKDSAEVRAGQPLDAGRDKSRAQPGEVRQAEGGRQQCTQPLKGIRASNGCTVKMVRVVGEGVKVLPGIRGFILNVMNELVNFVIGLKF